MNILLKIRNPYLDPTKLDTNLPAHKRKLFSRQEERKNVMLIWWRRKNLSFAEKP